jgi:hypothetical protein
LETRVKLAGVSFIGAVLSTAGLLWTAATRDDPQSSWIVLMGASAAGLGAASGLAARRFSRTEAITLGVMAAVLSFVVLWVLAIGIWESSA